MKDLLAEFDVALRLGERLASLADQLGKAFVGGGQAAGQLGEKYVCFSCGAKFYDLGKPEPRCPKCGADQREAPRQVRPRLPAAPEVAEERPVKRSRLLDEDEDEIVVDTETEADTDDLDLGLGVVDEGEDFGPDEPEEEEPEEEP